MPQTKLKLKKKKVDGEGSLTACEQSPELNLDEACLILHTKLMLPFFYVKLMLLK